LIDFYVGYTTTFYKTSQHVTIPTYCIPDAFLIVLLAFLLPQNAAQPTISFSKHSNPAVLNKQLTSQNKSA